MNRVRRPLALLLTLGVLAGALVYAIMVNPEWRRFDLQRFLAGLKGFSPGWVVLAIVIVYTTFWVRAVRWRILMGLIKPKASVWNLSVATVIGFGAIGLMGRPGEVVRPYLIARKENVAFSGQLAVWLLERAVDGLVILVAAGWALAQLELGSYEISASMEPVLDAMGTSIGVGAIAVLALLTFFRSYYGPFATRLVQILGFLSERRRAALWHLLEVFDEGLHAIRDNRTFLLCLLWTAIDWLLIIAAFYSAFAACNCGIRLSIAEMLVFMAVLMAGSLLHIPGIGGGLQVSAVLVLTGLYGFDVEPATGVALLLWLLTFVAVIPPALLLVAAEGLSWRKLREVGSEA